MIQISKKNIQIITLKNKKKAKKNIKVSQNTTFQQVLEKVTKSFTSKQFTLQIRSRDGLSYKLLTKDIWNHFIKNYAGQQINIATNLLSHSILQQPQYNLQQQKLSSNLQQSGKQQIINQTYQQITTYVKNLAEQKVKDKLNIIKGREFKDNLKCFQCKQIIHSLYYKCLICKEFILCEHCEQNESENQLVNHKYRSHPFAIIRPQTTQLCQNMKITTLKAEQIKLEQAQMPAKPIEKEQINKMLKQIIKTIYERIYQQDLN